MEPEGSLAHSEMPATCPYPGPARSSPYPHILIPITLIIFCENGGLKILAAFFRSFVRSHSPPSPSRSPTCPFQRPNLNLNLPSPLTHTKL
jgi:hypothetical protein